jgi:hypothetical protein
MSAKTLPQPNTATIVVDLNSNGLPEADLQLLCSEADRKGTTLNVILQELARKRAAELRAAQAA